MYNENGDIQLLDGYHRIAESLIKGNGTVDIEIVHDERTGYSHQQYSLIQRESAAELDADLLYGGLEHIVSECDLDFLFKKIEKNKTSEIQDFLKTKKQPNKYREKSKNNKT